MFLGVKPITFTRVFICLLQRTLDLTFHYRVSFIYMRIRDPSVAAP